MTARSKTEKSRDKQRGHGKFIASSEAKSTKKQHVVPCSDCPWRRNSLPGWLGPLDARQWLAVAHGDGEPGCHTCRTPDGGCRSCAGLAMFRANVCKVPRDPEALRLSPNTVTVFASNSEFEAHHGK